jgi:threonine dehydratase
MIFIYHLGLLTEPAAALSVTGLDHFAQEIKGKNVVCLISGGNNDLGRMHDIRVFSEIYQGIRYYILVDFFMKAGAIKQFLTDCLGPDDEVIKMEYTRKNNREKGPALVGL